MSLFELALILGIVAITGGYFTAFGARQVDLARAQRTLDEMRAILDAGKAYQSAHGTWPGSIQAAGEFLSSIPARNPWDKEYSVLSSEGGFWVETEVGGNIRLKQGKWPVRVWLQQDGTVRWRMGVPLSYGVTARLVYEK